MNKNRLEAFSDGVFAIIITIMVLEIKVPQEATLTSLLKLVPIFLSYVISFIYVGIYWNNHHHLLHSVVKINGKVLWSNLLLLFWLSLIPFSSGWMGVNHFKNITVLLYGIILFGCAFSYYLLTISLLKNQCHDSIIHKAIQNKLKERISLTLYVLGLSISFWYPLLAIAIYIIVAIMWMVPDDRIEKAIHQ